VKLEESKEIGDVWMVASLRQPLKKYISIQTDAQCLSIQGLQGF